jgi:hypothetical protein
MRAAVLHDVSAGPGNRVDDMVAFLINGECARGST